jgi:hypothetical protein
VAGVVLLASLPPGASASTTWAPDPVSWTNGFVLCDFSASAPSVAVSHLGTTESGMTVSVLNVSEVTANQQVVASALLGSTTWQVSNLSTTDAYDLSYSTHALLEGPTGSAPVTGSTDLTTSFLLPSYQGSPEGPTDSVNVVFTVANWTWQGTGDHLALSFAISPTYPSAEHLNVTNAPGWSLASTSNSSGSVLERMGAGTSANATLASGSTEPVPVAAQLTIDSPSHARMGVSFGASAGEFSSLTFQSKVGVVLPASVAGIPLSELLAAAAGGVAVSALVAIGARRVRRKPSKLIYATESEDR